MKVKELIENLSELDQESYLFVHGYEGGYNDVGFCSDEIQMVRDVNDAWYYGKHELLEDKWQIRHINLDTKVVDKGYIIGAD
jgi:hypothetical protein